MQPVSVAMNMTRERSILLAAVLASVLVPCATRVLDAQGSPSLPSCRRVDPLDQPCALPFDTAPVLKSRPAAATHPGEQRTTQLWVHVDTAGAVRTARVHRTAGIDWDLTAADVVRQYTFEPATLRGAPTPAWMLIEVATAPAPQSCADFPMAVPLSAGVAQFVDSAAHDDPRGWRYRFRTEENLTGDVTLFRQRDNGSPEEVVMKAIRMVEVAAVEQGAGPVRVRSSGAQEVRTERGARKRTYKGYSARLGTSVDGEPGELYIGVFPAAESYVMIRMPSAASRRGRATADEFARQILTHEHWRLLGCPRW